MAKSLPKHVIIQTSLNDNRYLRLSKENPVLPNALQFVGDYMSTNTTCNIRNNYFKIYHNTLNPTTLYIKLRFA
ncbi:hypothetical protein ACHQM5_000186 [Ranunculus cassubicifolius]